MSDDVTRPGGGGLEGQLDKLRSEVEELRATRQSHVFKAAGYEPGSPEARTLERTYDGAEGDVEAVRTFARDELGWELPGDEGSLDAPGWNEAKARALSEGEERSRMAMTGALPVRDPSPEDLLAQAEAIGRETDDWTAFNKLAARKLEAARRGMPDLPRPGAIR